jgi:hypothetical protein
METEEMEGGVPLYVTGMLENLKVRGMSKEPSEMFRSNTPDPEGTEIVEGRSAGAETTIELSDDGTTT